MLFFNKQYNLFVFYNVPCVVSVIWVPWVKIGNYTDSATGNNICFILILNIATVKWDCISIQLIRFLIGTKYYSIVYRATLCHPRKSQVRITKL